MATRGKVIAGDALPKPGQDRMVLDAGNGGIKGINGAGTEVFWTHALKEVTEADYGAWAGRGGHNDVYRVKVGKKWRYYVVADTAIKQGIQPRVLGGSRYVREYYGVIAAITLFRLYKSSRDNVFVYGSHAPVDYIRRSDLVKSVMGKWEVGSQGVAKTFDVTGVAAFDEPVGGAMNYILAPSGIGLAGNALCIDIGALTTDVTALDNGIPDYSSIWSERSGINDVQRNFEKFFRAQHKDILTGAMNPRRIRDAIQTGWYKAGAFGKLDAQDAVNYAVRDVVRNVMDSVIHYGGLGEYEAILLTGGGGGALLDHIKAALWSDDLEAQYGSADNFIFLCDKNRDEIQMANARGGHRILKALMAHAARQGV